MKFSDFLLNENADDESSDQIDKYRLSILNDIKQKNKDILVLNTLYTKDYKNKNDILKDDVIEGYFIYNKNDPGDNSFYAGEFKYNVVKKENEDSLEVSDPFSSINDLDFYLKTTLKAFKI